MVTPFNQDDYPGKSRSEALDEYMNKSTFGLVRVFIVVLILAVVIISSILWVGK